MGPVDKSQPPILRTSASELWSRKDTEILVRAVNEYYHRLTNTREKRYAVWQDIYDSISYQVTLDFYLFYTQLELLKNCGSKVCSDRILTFGIRSICSPAKVGLVVTELLINVSWRGWEAPPPPSQHRGSTHSLKTSLCVWTAFVDVCLHLVEDWFLRH